MTVGIRYVDGPRLARSLLAAVNRPAERAFRVSSGDVEGLLERAPLQASRAAGPGPERDTARAQGPGRIEVVRSGVPDGTVPTSR